MISWSCSDKIIRSSAGNVFLRSKNVKAIYVDDSDNAHGLRREMCSSGPRMAQTMLTVFGGKCVPQVQEWLRQCSWSSAGNIVIRYRFGHSIQSWTHEETFSTSQLPIKEWFMISEDRSKCATQLTILVAMIANTILAVMLKNSYETF